MRRDGLGPSGPSKGPGFAHMLVSEPAAGQEGHGLSWVAKPGSRAPLDLVGRRAPASRNPINWERRQWFDKEKGDCCSLRGSPFHPGVKRVPPEWGLTRGWKLETLGDPGSWKRWVIWESSAAYPSLCAVLLSCAVLRIPIVSPSMGGAHICKCRLLTLEKLAVSVGPLASASRAASPTPPLSPCATESSSLLSVPPAPGMGRDHGRANPHILESPWHWLFSRGSHELAEGLT